MYNSVIDHFLYLGHVAVKRQKMLKPFLKILAKINYYIISGHPKTLNQFTYNDKDINDIILSCMSNVSMTGITGNIAFGEGSDPIKNVKIERIQGSCMLGSRHRTGPENHKNARLWMREYSGWTAFNPSKHLHQQWSYHSHKTAL